MRRSDRATAAILAWIFALPVAGCSEDSPSEPAEPTPCDAAVVITVSPGPVPTFSWTPTCMAHWLLVEPAGSGTDSWGVVTDGENALATPIRYATVPDGARQFNPPALLNVGTTYDVYLTRFIGPTDVDIELIGTASFTP